MKKINWNRVALGIFAAILTMGLSLTVFTAAMEGTTFNTIKLALALLALQCMSIAL